MLDHAQVRALLRQRHPMLLLDRVSAVEPGTSIVALKAVSAAEPCYRNVAEGAGIGDVEYPVPLLIESFGQATSVLWALSGFTLRGAVPLLGSVRDVVIGEPVVPGDVIEHQVWLDHSSGGTGVFRGHTSCSGRTVLTVGSLLVVARPADDLRAAS